MLSSFNEAKTHILIQHGSNDQCVSAISIHELHRFLSHKGVTTDLIILLGMVHGYLTPRETYEVLLQNNR